MPVDMIKSFSDIEQDLHYGLSFDDYAPDLVSPSRTAHPSALGIVALHLTVGGGPLSNSFRHAFGIEPVGCAIEGNGAKASICFGDEGSEHDLLLGWPLAKGLKDPE